VLISSVRTGHLLLRENDGLVLGRIGYTVCGLGAQPVGHQLRPTNQPIKQTTSKCECGCRERYARVVSWEVTSIQSADHMNARRWLIRCPTRDVPTPRAGVWVSVNVTQRLYIGYDGLAGRTDGIIPIPGCNGKKKRTGALDTSSAFVLLLLLLLCTRSRDL
jgi:hypothetical protein